MEKRQRIQNLLDRLDVLEGRSSKKTRIQGLLARLDGLTKEKEEKRSRKKEIVSVIEPRVKGLLGRLTKARRENAARFEDVGRSFGEETRAIRAELVASQRKGAELTEERIGQIVERMREMETGFEGKLKFFEDTDSMLAAEMESLRQALDSIEMPDTSGIQANEEALEALKEDIKELERRINSRLAALQNNHGGNMNRSIVVGGNADTLGMFTDINLKAGPNVSISYSPNRTTQYTDITISATDSDTGIVRSIQSTAVDTSAGAVDGTDYVYVCTATLTLTLPTAIGNENLYTVKNTGAGTVTIAATGGELIDGSATIEMPVQYTSVDLISDGSAWNIT